MEIPLNAVATGVDVQRVTDVVDSARQFGEDYLSRVYTSAERRETGDRPARLAARFAAKEAVAKAVGLGDAGFAWTDIEVTDPDAGPVQVRLTGEPAHRAARAGIDRWRVSIATAGGLAAAVAVAGTPAQGPSL